MRALQVVQLIFILLWVLTEVHGASHGLDRLANLFLALLAVASFWAIRLGRFRLSVVLLLFAVVGSPWTGLLGTGLTAQLVPLRYVVLPQLLAALTLGAAALWIVSGAVGLAILAGAAIDEAAGIGPPASENPWLAALQALLFLVFVALVLDRMGAVLRRALSRSLDNEARVREGAGHDRGAGAGGGIALPPASTVVRRNAAPLSAALDLRWGALLHDIGKIAVPDHILHKREALSPEEWEIVRRHPDQGLAMLEDVSYLGPSLDIVRHHHEHWDGSGYPAGLAGESIPRLARIFSVADAYDAMASGRPYREALPEPEVRAELRRVAGHQLDPGIVEAFLALDTGRLEEVCRRAESGPPPRSSTTGPAGG